MEHDDLLDVALEEKRYALVSVPQFIVLSVMTFGLYELWWMYKAFRYFKQRDQSDILPFWRAVFAVLFVYGLFQRVLVLAREDDYQHSYDPGWLTTGWIILSYSANILPDWLWYVSFLA
ncbi:MAG: DUF4234 domain-containing protein, partial [Bacteroidota bacterium]